MQQPLDDILIDKEEGNTYKDKIAFGLSLVMLIGGILYLKFFTVSGSRASWLQLFISSFLFIIICIGFNVITNLISRIFRKNKQAQNSIKSKAFWLDRVIGGFIIWLILMLLVFSDIVLP